MFAFCKVLLQSLVSNAFVLTNFLFLPMYKTHPLFWSYNLGQKGASYTRVNTVLEGCPDMDSSPSVVPMWVANLQSPPRKGTSWLQCCNGKPVNGHRNLTASNKDECTNLCKWATFHKSDCNRRVLLDQSAAENSLPVQQQRRPNEIGLCSSCLSDGTLLVKTHFPHFYLNRQNTAALSLETRFPQLCCSSRAHCAESTERCGWEATQNVFTEEAFAADIWMKMWRNRSQQMFGSWKSEYTPFQTKSERPPGFNDEESSTRTRKGVKRSKWKTLTFTWERIRKEISTKRSAFSDCAINNSSVFVSTAIHTGCGNQFQKIQHKSRLNSNVFFRLSDFSINLSGLPRLDLHSAESFRSWL